MALAIAAVHGLRATSGLTWPGEPDLYRDMAQARTFLNGEWLGDPFYRDEASWYPPLVPAIVAVLATLTGLPVPRLYAQAGSVLNLASPVFFFLLARLMVGPRAAVASLAGFLFLQPSALPAWATATYSPWLMAGVFAQGLFYAALALLLVLIRRPGVGRSVFVGLVAGVALLAHAAAGSILLPVLAAVCWRARRYALLAVALVAAAVVASPFLSVIAPRGRVLNPAPFDWTWMLLEPGQADAFLFAVVTPATALALVGLWTWWKRPWTNTEARVALAVWVSVAFFLLLYVTASPRLRVLGFSPPRLTPAFHFLVYLKAAESLLFGAGFERAVELLARRLGARGFAFYAVWAAMVAVAMPSYAGRREFTIEREKAVAQSARGDRTQAVAWIEAHTATDDVLLASDDAALQVVGPSGRKTVAVDRFFSNPYVDHDARSRRRDRMFDAARDGDAEGFLRLARRLHVRWVVAEPAAVPEPPPPFLSPGFATGSWRVLRVVDPAAR